MVSACTDRSRRLLKPFFFYGTLRDPDVVAAVLGRRPAAAPEPAEVQGWRAAPVTGASYPVLVPDPGYTATGVLLGGLTPADIRRLVAYEGPGYRMAGITVARTGDMVEAQVFLPVSGIAHSSGVWSFETWQKSHRAAWLARLRGR
jgi:hypothetical protein